MDDLKKLTALIRYYCLISTSAAGSGHLTSSLSATDLMTVLFFGGFLKYDTKNPENPNNDRIIFSKGHASPLFYSLWAAAGEVSEEELLTLRKFGSPLEGHPTMEFKFTEAPTGSLGQGLSIGLGMALAGKLDGLDYKTYVLLGDSETAEGSVWEAIQLASYYKLHNLVGIIDVNRLGQRGETMYGWEVNEYKKRISSFGWETIVIDGHNLSEISHAFSVASSAQRPVMIIAKTIKGKGIKFLENKENFHGKPLPQDKVGEAEKDLGQIDKSIRGTIAKPLNILPKNNTTPARKFNVAQYSERSLISTRKAFGEALLELGSANTSLVSLDAEVSNSTYSEIFGKEYPERFFEMFIAEQNMVGAAIGLCRRGKIPFVSTFAAFLTRAHDQIRMAAYTKANIKFVGSHAGVSIGEDGASQMGLEDISMFRALEGSVVLYPSDAVSTTKLMQAAVSHKGLVYIRITRKETPVIYHAKEQFEIGGSKILKSSDKDVLTVVGAGITVFEALKAYEQLEKDGIFIKVIDLYSAKPIDCATLLRAGEVTKGIIIVEDHRPEGGIFESVSSCLSSNKIPVYSLAVNKMPRSGTPEELLGYEQIDSKAIVEKVKELLLI